MNKAIEEYYKCLDGGVAKMNKEKELHYQTMLLEQIEMQTRGHFARDFAANVLGNAAFDGGVFLVSKLIKDIKL